MGNQFFFTEDIFESIPGLSSLIKNRRVGPSASNSSILKYKGPRLRTKKSTDKRFK